MICPNCQCVNTIVIDTRRIEHRIRRRRACERCKQRFTTYEITDLDLAYTDRQAKARKAVEVNTRDLLDLLFRRADQAAYLSLKIQPPKNIKAVTESDIEQWL